MDRANIAEWILRRVIEPDRASELVGDRLETRPAEGGFRFWLFIGGLVAVFSWRTVLGIAAAAIGGVFLSWTPFAGAFTRLYALDIRAPGPPPSPGYYLAISLLLWSAAVFSLVRFGSRNDLTKVAWAWALLGAYAFCTFWMPNADVAILVGVTAFLLLFVWSSENRRALAVLLASIASGGLAMYLLFHIPINKLNLAPKWLETILFLQLLLIVIVECETASFLHRKLLVRALNSGTTR
jgi:hypothetical protein